MQAQRESGEPKFQAEGELVSIGAPIRSQYMPD